MWLHCLPNAKATQGFNSLMHNKKDTGHCYLLWHDLVKVAKKKYKTFFFFKSECSAFTNRCLLCEGSSKTCVREATIVPMKESGRKVVCVSKKITITSTVDALSQQLLSPKF